MNYNTVNSFYKVAVYWDKELKDTILNGIINYLDATTIFYYLIDKNLRPQYLTCVGPSRGCFMRNVLI